ncbi:MAG: hypothetical protein ABSC06_12560 [Rhodopila sp.]
MAFIAVKQGRALPNLYPAKIVSLRLRRKQLTAKRLGLPEGSHVEVVAPGDATVADEVAAIHGKLSHPRALLFINKHVRQARRNPIVATMHVRCSIPPEVASLFMAQLCAHLAFRRFAISFTIQLHKSASVFFIKRPHRNPASPVITP